MSHRPSRLTRHDQALADYAAVTIRTMRDGDVDACEQVWHEAWGEMRARFHLPAQDVSSGAVARMRARIRHLLTTDPSGSFVADDGHGVVGVAQALVRDRLWVLSLFAVAVHGQGQGIGRSLLAAALRYGEGGPGMILASRDPRAMRRYAAARFRLHPAVMAWGRVRHERLASAADVREGGIEVREGGIDDTPLVEEIDRQVRGASRGPDLDHLLGEGATLLLGDRGYAVVRDGRPLIVAATSDGAAARLLLAALLRAPHDRDVEVSWLTAGQQWAIDMCLRAGLELHPSGPVMIRGRQRPPAPYLPSGAFG
jgi:ribosomal protein S18 acetylase RimI-like enzyme